MHLPTLSVVFFFFHSTIYVLAHRNIQVYHRTPLHQHMSKTTSISTTTTKVAGDYCWAIKVCFFFHSFILLSDNLSLDYLYRNLNNKWPPTSDTRMVTSPRRHNESHSLQTQHGEPWWRMAATCGRHSSGLEMLKSWHQEKVFLAVMRQLRIACLCW